MLIYSLRQTCTFLATERLYRGFGTALTPPLAPPGQRCSVGGRNDPAGSQHCFWGRESICSCLCFQDLKRQHLRL